MAGVSVDVLKLAYSDGYKAFHTVVQNTKGIYQNPTNIYQKNSLPYKEWDRGFNAAYIENKRKVV